MGPDNPLEARAYRALARGVGATAPFVADLVERDGDSPLIAGAGERTIEHLRDLVRSGTIPRLGGLRAQVPPVLVGGSMGAASLVLAGVTSGEDRPFDSAWHRDAASFCTAATFDPMNGLRVAWSS